jgi:hypothetical protein
MTNISRERRSNRCPPRVCLESASVLLLRRVVKIDKVQFICLVPQPNDGAAPCIREATCPGRGNWPLETLSPLELKLFIEFWCPAEPASRTKLHNHFALSINMRSTGPRHAESVADDAAVHDAARVDGGMPQDHNHNGDPAAVNTTADAKTNTELIADVAAKLDITLV